MQNKTGSIWIGIFILAHAGHAEAQSCGQKYVFNREQAELNNFGIGRRPASLRVLECGFIKHDADNYTEACTFTVNPTEFKQVFRQPTLTLVQRFRNDQAAMFNRHRIAPLPAPMVWEYRMARQTVYADSGHEFGLATYHVKFCPPLEEVITQ